MLWVPHRDCSSAQLLWAWPKGNAAAEQHVDLGTARRTPQEQAGRQAGPCTVTSSSLSARLSGLAAGNLLKSCSLAYLDCSAASFEWSRGGVHAKSRPAYPMGYISPLGLLPCVQAVCWCQECRWAVYGLGCSVLSGLQELMQAAVLHT